MSRPNQDSWELWHHIQSYLLFSCLGTEKVLSAHRSWVSQDLFRGGGEAINSVKTELLFCLLEKKLTKTEHKRRVIAKLAICKKKKSFFMKWEKIMESNSLEKVPGIQEVLE